MKLQKRNTILFLLLLLPFITEAKSFNKGKSDGHEADAYAIMPFARSTIITDWFETIHKTIDFPYNTYFPGLREGPHKNFSWGKYGHRIFFHWGFNGKPWNNQLQEMVGKCNWNDATVTSFKQKIVNEQARRNRLVMESTAETLGFGMSGKLRDYSNAFASLVYNSHLLGDYTTTKIATLQDVNLVIDDIKTALFNKLQGGDAAKAINKRLDAAKTQYPDPAKRADYVLNLLKKELPGFILNTQNGYFKRHFKSKQIPLKENLK